MNADATNHSRNKNLGLGRDHSCPYLRSTARHSPPTRQLWAASVAPQRNRLVQLMPPERSHSRAAAGLHGASSAKSMALAAEPESASNGPINRHVKTAVFILNRPSVILRSGLHNCFSTGIPAHLCVAQSAVNPLKRRDYLPNIRMNFGGRCRASAVIGRVGLPTHSPQRGSSCWSPRCGRPAGYTKRRALLITDTPPATVHYSARL